MIVKVSHLSVMSVPDFSLYETKYGHTGNGNHKTVIQYKNVLNLFLLSL